MEANTRKVRGWALALLYPLSLVACATGADPSTERSADPALGDAGTVVAQSCGQVEIPIQRVAPNVMILLDRSGSMDNAVEGSNRWDVAKAAIRRVTETFNDRIRFGLATFPSCENPQCGEAPGKVVVPVTESNASGINDGFLAPLTSGRSSPPVAGAPRNYLCGRDGDPPQTNTGASLHAMRNDPALQDRSRPRAVLLVTDGQESSECVRNGRDGANGAARLLNDEIKTFVVGFATDSPSLGGVAQAGGTQRAYIAMNTRALNEALENIANSLASCEYQLDQEPPDPNDFFIYFNNSKKLLRDDPNGWSYDAASRKLQFLGSACDDVKAGRIEDIDVIFGCDAPLI